MLDIAGADLHEVILINQARLAFAHVRLEDVEILLPSRILCPRFNVLGKRSLGKQVPHEIFGRGRTDYNRRDFCPNIHVDSMKYGKSAM